MMRRHSPFEEQQVPVDTGSYIYKYNFRDGSIPCGKRKKVLNLR